MTGERARLFVALELPRGAVEALVWWRERAVAGIEALRLLAPESLHVTLCFLGSHPAADIPAIAAAVDGTGAPELALSLGAPAWLPPRRPGVLAVEIDDPSGALARTQAAVAAALVTGGWYEPEPRPFLAHVTVARVRRGTRVRSVELPAPEPLAFAGTAVTLFRSRPGLGGSLYERLSGRRAPRGPSPSRQRQANPGRRRSSSPESR